ncbi:MAG: DUF6512 family protein [Mahellales bacterium]
MKDSRTAFIWEMIGIGVICGIASLFHFIFEWSGGFEPIGIIGAVNESVWEHMKIVFWAAFFYAVVEYLSGFRYNTGFLTAKTLSLYLIVIIIPLLFYGYTALLGRHILVLDILIMVIAVAAAQLTSWRIMIMKVRNNTIKWVSVAALILIIAIFSLLTYYPPRIFLFKDMGTGRYGIAE